MVKEKERLDVTLVKLGRFSSRERAQAAIMEGQVMVDGRVVHKAGTSVFPASRIDVKKEAHPYVSRGGAKLAQALRDFNIAVEGKIALDVGSSTGGFIDCLLRHGAVQVIGVDVGYGQLAWSLRNNPRVTILERTNARHLRPDDLPGPVDLITVDVSFISTTKIIPALKAMLRENGEMVVLIKPQFEAARGTAKKGVVKEKSVHMKVLKELSRFFQKEGLLVKGFTYSPIAGAEGNIEFFLHLAKSVGETTLAQSEREEQIEKLVEEAHCVVLQK